MPTLIFGTTLDFDMVCNFSFVKSFFYYNINTFISFTALPRLSDGGVTVVLATDSGRTTNQSVLQTYKVPTRLSRRDDQNVDDAVGCVSETDVVKNVPVSSIQ